MSDEPFYSPHRQPAPRRQPTPGATLIAFVRDGARVRCELRSHGAYGVEAQFLKEGELLVARRFAARVRAEAWAHAERAAIERGAR